MEQLFCRADVAGDRRARCGLCLCSRQGHGLGRSPRLTNSACATASPSRRQPDHGRGRGVLADHTEDQRPSRHRQLLRDMETAETEDARVVVVKFGPNPARSAALTAAKPADFVEGVLFEAGLRRNLDGAAARQRSPTRSASSSRALPGIRARQGLVGREAAGHARAEQLRRAALRLFPRPRYRVRRLYREELYIPRGVHVAGLGVALRFPVDQGRPGQA